MGKFSKTVTQVTGTLSSKQKRLVIKQKISGIVHWAYTVEIKLEHRVQFSFAFQLPTTKQIKTSTAGVQFTMPWIIHYPVRSLPQYVQKRNRK